MSLDLGLAPAEGNQHGEGEQFARGDVDTGTGEVVSEAVGRQIALDVLFVLRGAGVKRVNPFRADDLLLDGEALRRAGLWVVVDWPGSGSSTPRSARTSLVACRKSNTLAMPTYGTAWYTTSLASIGVTPTVRAAPSMARYSLMAWQAIIAAS